MAAAKKYFVIGEYTIFLMSLHNPFLPRWILKQELQVNMPHLVCRALAHPIYANKGRLEVPGLRRAPAIFGKSTKAISYGRVRHQMGIAVIPTS